jgi:MCP family monocarboxylic acid transporter-like MFS transporter 14
VSSLANQFGIRPVVMVGAFVTALMYALSAFAPSIYYIMITYGVIGGVSTGCTYIASLIIIAEYFDKKQGMATGVCMAGSGVGAFAFAPISQVLLNYFDWKYAIMIFGAIIMLCFLMGAVLRPVPTRPLEK